LNRAISVSPDDAADNIVGGCADSIRDYDISAIARPPTKRSMAMKHDERADRRHVAACVQWLCAATTFWQSGVS
jgi:hypothetical protein